MKALTLLLLLSNFAFSQLAPPTQSIKIKHGQTTTVAWDLTPTNTLELSYFSVKSTPDLNTPPTEIKQVPKTEHQTSLTVLFTSSFPKYNYYVISAVYTSAESFPSNTILAERIGPPPN